MPAQTETGLFCATNFGEYEISGSNGKVYHVSIDGASGTFCDCPAYKYSKGEVYDKTCKHIQQVWKEACMWNVQWFEGNNPHELLPASFNHSTLSGNGYNCPNCGGPTVPVRIAV